MDFDVKKEARRQYFHYFRFWLIGTALILLVAVGVNVVRMIARNFSRANTNVSAERVYDYAEVLTDEEEESLRELIAKLEKKCHADLVLVTIDQEVGSSDYIWEQTMMNLADNLFEDAQNGYAQPYGWDKAYGDGALLLDNWYEDENGSQKGSWLSTSGRVEQLIGSYEEGTVFDAMDTYIDSDPYRAYKAALEKLASYCEVGYGSGRPLTDYVGGSIVIATIVAVIYAVCAIRNAKAKDTTTPLTYVAGGRPKINVREDRFLRSDVVRRHIERDHGGSGHSSGGHHGGGSHGSHHSSSGHSHGGGGRRR